MAMRRNIALLAFGLVLGILGTVAGDDTLFVCADEKTQGAGVLAVLTRLADRTRPEGDT